MSGASKENHTCATRVALYWDDVELLPYFSGFFSVLNMSTTAIVGRLKISYTLNYQFLLNVFLIF
jgi:hypothetical protein